MANQSEIKIKYSILNSDFNSKIKDINKSITTLNKSFKLQKEEMKHTASESEKLSASVKNLNQKYDLAKQKTEETRKAYENAKKALGENANETKAWGDKLLDAKKNEESLKNQIIETNKKLEEAKRLEAQNTEEVKKAAQASKDRQEKLKGMATEQDRLKASSEKLSKEYELQVASLSKNASESEKLKLKQEYLQKSFENSEKSVENLKKQLEVAESEYGKNSKEVDKLEKELFEAEIASKKFAKEIAESNNKLKNFGDQVSKTGEKTKKIGESMSKNVTAPIVAAGALSLKAFKEIDAGEDIVIKKTGATGESAKQLKEEFKNVFSNFPADADVVGNALGEINTQFGFTGKELESATTLMLEYSRVTDEDVTGATIHAKQAIEQYGLSGKDLEMVLDSVAKVAQDTGASTSELFDEVIKGAPALTSMGLGFSESVTLLGNFHKAGLDSTRTLSALNKAQVEFAKEGKTVKEGMQELIPAIKNAANEQEAINLASQTFGTKNGPALAKAIREGTITLDDFTKSASNSKGAVHETFKGVADDTDEAKKAMNAFKVAGAELGAELLKTLAPIIKDVAKTVRDLAKKFQGLSPHTKQMIVKAALIAAAIGPLLVVIGQLMMGIGGITKGLTMVSPAIAGLIPTILGAIPVIVALAGAFMIGKYIYQHWDEVTAYLGQKIEDIKGFFVGIGDGISSTFNDIKNWTKETFENMGNTIHEKMEEADSFLNEKWEAIGSYLSDKWENLKSSASQKWEDMKNNIQKNNQFIKDNVITPIWNATKDYLANKWENIKSDASQKWESIKSTVSQKSDETRNKLNEAWTNIHNNMSNKWNNLKTLAGNTWHNIVSTIQDKMNWAKNIVSDAIDFILNIFSNIHIEFPTPHIPMPHIVGWDDIGFGISIPDIDWYATGGIATGPSVVGIGEAGNEAIVPLQGKYMKPFAQAVADMINGQGGGNAYITMNNDIKETVDIDKSMDRVEKWLNRKGYKVAYGRGV